MGFKIKTLAFQVPNQVMNQWWTSPTRLSQKHRGNKPQIPNVDNTRNGDLPIPKIPCESELAMVW